ncbi:MAG: prepilin-type N-terminal cleavage/methylation domain-containing protein [Patescibacteria group bacterium]
MRNRGFSLIEIILALAVAVIVFISVFHFASTLYIKTIAQDKNSRENFSYSYGETYCSSKQNINSSTVILHQTSPEGFISTSTRITSIHVLQSLPMTQLLITSDSASTTEADIFIFNINQNDNTAELISSIDAGPGIQDSKLLDNYLYIANTSVNSHVKSYYLDLEATGTAMFQELSNIKIVSLAQSSSLPKKLSIFNKQLILGSEKSNTGGEMFVFPFEQNGAVQLLSHTQEFDGQVNQALSSYGKIYVAAASDPELRIFDSNLTQEQTYDAPLTLGNGKSVLHIPSYIILGRTLGSGELSILSATTSVLDIKRTDGTVDYLQAIDGSNPLEFLSITANENKELQFWHIVESAFGAKLKQDKTIDIPGRVTAYTCALNRMYAFVFINNQATLIWFDL